MNNQNKYKQTRTPKCRNVRITHKVWLLLSKLISNGVPQKTKRCPGQGGQKEAKKTKTKQK